MTDSHAHIESGSCRTLIAEPCKGAAAFAGFHPWHLEAYDISRLRSRLERDTRLGVGEIGLDRLKCKEITPFMRKAFLEQLDLAALFGRSVVLHGAKCWGEVVKECEKRKGRIPAFLFHGFSRSEGLVPAIAAMNGFISVGPAILNDHAVNYRAMARNLPEETILVETDNEEGKDVVDVALVAAKLAEIRGVSFAEIEKTTDENAARFMAAIS